MSSDKPVLEWKDITSCSRGAERIPNVWEAEFGIHFRVTVVKNHRHFPGTWVFLFDPLNVTQVLGDHDTFTIEQAQNQAEVVASLILGWALRALGVKI